MSNRSILILTLPPFAGGVPAKCHILAQWLRRRGHRVTIAYYATLSDHPELVAPSWSLRRPGLRQVTVWDEFPGWAVGCRFPELEFPYYLPSSRWDQLIAGHDRHVAVGGTVLVSYPLVAAGIPHLTWCAATMIEDRRDRRAAMPMPRRCFDRLVTGPVQAAMERRILAGSGHILPVSGHTARLFAAAGRPCPVLPIPVRPDFSPPHRSAPAGIVGFAGRLNDPRKNLGLLVDAVTLAVKGGADLRLRLAGDHPGAALTARLTDPVLAGRVECLGPLPSEQLADFYGGLDVFALPSLQEGLAIVGTEALACGVPVVSTRCGGPADYVVDGQTGWLVDDAQGMADRLTAIAADRQLRQRLSQGALALVAGRYDGASFDLGLERAWTHVWGERP